MAVISETGDPTLYAKINASGGTGGSFFVYDDDASNNRFEVKDDGNVVVHGAIQRNAVNVRGPCPQRCPIS